MKAKFSSADVVAMCVELKKLIGMRVIQVYDVDSKTYLFKLGRKEEKSVLIFESGVRIHTTEYDWPKGMTPSGFSMKLRKHLKNKRLEKISQIGIDRIVDMQFGINDAAYHVIVELYDRGNVVLADCDYMILNILRPRQLGSEDVRIAVREKYPVGDAIQQVPQYSENDIAAWISEAKESDTVKKVIVAKVCFGPAVLEHVLLARDISANTKVKKILSMANFSEKLHSAINEGNELIENLKTPGVSTGVIALKVESRVKAAEDGSMEITAYDEFHPYPFRQLAESRTDRFDTFSQAVDAYFSKQEEQKINLRAHNLEKEAVKKLENVRLDHQKRLAALEDVQITDVQKAELIENNLDLVEKALFAVRSFVAAQYSWDEIGNMIKEAQSLHDPVACSIKQLHLSRNQFGMLLSNSFEGDLAPSVVDIDLDLSAYANARRYFDMKKHAAKKQQKTIESSAKALKSAQRKTKEVLKQVELTTNIARSRKTYWFEKFFWFISSENYLVIGGRDAQQNELIVKKYLTKGDIYVHGDLHGASSVVIKNPSGEQVHPKTLNEAGTMAICYSAAWEAKVITSAWWVYHHQVSKTAPTGEYLTAGSFMVRGKKNYLPPLYLIMGFGFMFRLDEESIPAHQDERKVRMSEDTVEVSEANDSAALDEEQNEVNISSSEEEEAEEEEQNVASAFPDTHVEFMPLLGITAHQSNKPADEEIIVHSQAVKSKKIVTVQNKKKLKGQKKEVAQEAAKSTSEKNQPKQPKKLSKAKLRKIKQRYGDQDNEERELRMKILASAGKQQTRNVPADPPAEESVENSRKQSDDENQKQPNQQSARLTDLELDEEKNGVDQAAAAAAAAAAGVDDNNVDDDNVNDDDDDDDNLDNDEVPTTNDMTTLLNSLTAIPNTEDILLYAVPVCAPYSTMTNYKFKVKLTPGTAKRGKAAKTALNMFQYDKTATQREKDLLRACKDQDVARNLPGKVKLSAPNLQKSRK